MQSYQFGGFRSRLESHNCRTLAGVPYKAYMISSYHRFYIKSSCRDKPAHAPWLNPIGVLSYNIYI